jgi:hypothetical protein
MGAVVSHLAAAVSGLRALTDAADSVRFLLSARV